MEEQFEYPIYKQSNHTGIVVKFTGLTEGNVVIGNSSNETGKYSSDWNRHNRDSDWTDYKPKLNLYL